MKLFVGSLPFETSEEDLKNLFSPHGAVTSTKIITDRETGRSRGFGFVEMPNDTEAKVAIEKMNGSSVGGRQIAVNEARPMEKRSGGGFGGGGNRGGGFGGGGNRGGGFGGGGGGWGGDRGGRGGGRDRGGDRGGRGGGRDRGGRGGGGDGSWR